MTSIFVAKLDFGVSSEQLRNLFEQHGKVLKANVATDRETGKSRGFAFVEMADKNEAMAAISALDGHIITGRPIAVKEAEQRENRTPSTRPPYDSQKPREPRSDAPYGAPKDPSTVLPSLDIPSNEPRKKVAKEKDRKTAETDNRNKKPKMDAFKKSGKEKKFFDDDDDFDDEELFSYKRKDDEDFDDEEEDED